MNSSLGCFISCTKYPHRKLANAGAQIAVTIFAQLSSKTNLRVVVFEYRQSRIGLKSFSISQDIENLLPVTMFFNTHIIFTITTLIVLSRVSVINNFQILHHCNLKNTTWAKTLYPLPNLHHALKENFYKRPKQKTAKFKNHAKLLPHSILNFQPVFQHKLNEK